MADKATFSSDQPKTRRKVGAQPANSNHLQHGLYSQHFTPDEFELILAASVRGLENEIRLMRICLGRLLGFANGVESLDGAARVFDLIGLSSTRLASLLQTETLLGSDRGSKAVEALSQALAEVTRDLGIDERWKRAG